MVKYIAPEMDMIIVETADIILASGEIDKGDEDNTTTPGLGGRG